MKRVIAFSAISLLMFSFIFALLPSVYIDNTNLAPLPTNSGSTPDWGVWEVYQGPANANNHIDNSVTYNGKATIRSDPATASNPFREIDSIWIAVSPGSHLLFSCWIKTGPSGGQTSSNAGTIGLDWYGDNGRITGISDETNPNRFVGWDQDWTQIIISMTVPRTLDNDGAINSSLTGDPETPNGVILWLGASYHDTGLVRFANAEVHINPSDSPYSIIGNLPLMMLFTLLVIVAIVISAWFYSHHGTTLA